MSFEAFGLYLHRLTTVLAVHRVGIVAVQAAFAASVFDLGRLEDGSGKPDKEGHAKDHYEY